MKTAENSTASLPKSRVRPIKLWTTFLVGAICLAAVGQPPSIEKWVDTKVIYTDAAGKSVMVHNSLPKGGGNYIDSDGKKYSYVIFWTRVMNESVSPIELTIKFPTDPLTLFPSPDAHIKLFLPPEVMTLDKVLLGDYGLTHLKSFLDDRLNKPSILQRTIPPNEEYLFYIAVLFYKAGGTTRAALVLEGQNLFFRISVAPELDAALIPCGQLVFTD